MFKIYHNLFLSGNYEERKLNEAKRKSKIAYNIVVMLNSLASTNFTAIWELYKKYSMLSVWKSLRKDIEEVLLVYEGKVGNEETIELGEIKLKIDQKVKVIPDDIPNETMREDVFKKADSSNDMMNLNTIRLSQTASFSKRTTFCGTKNESTESWNEFVDALLSESNRDVHFHDITNCSMF